MKRVLAQTLCAGAVVAALIASPATAAAQAEPEVRPAPVGGDCFFPNGKDVFWSCVLVPILESVFSGSADGTSGSAS